MSTFESDLEDNSNLDNVMFGMRVRFRSEGQGLRR